MAIWTILDIERQLLIDGTSGHQLKEMSEEEQLLLENINLISSGLFNCQTEEQVELAISFAKFLDGLGLSRTNYPLYLRLIGTNNPWVVDALVGRREAHLLFASIPPSPYVIRKAFGILSFFHPDIIYQKTLEATLGIIEAAYHDPDDGFEISPFKISDLNTLGKYLDKRKDQFDPTNTLILQILDRLSYIGEYNKERTKNVLARHAFNLRFAFFDHLKKLEDVIPQVLLYNAARRERILGPTSEYRKVILAKSEKLGDD